MNACDAQIAAEFSKMALHDARRHLFLCVGPNCCSTEAGLASWDYIKRRLKETGQPALRTKAACLRICRGGPWLVVYPEGIWYGNVTEQRFERILNEHLIAGKPIAEWIAATKPLCVTENPSPAETP